MFFTLLLLYFTNSYHKLEVCPKSNFLSLTVNIKFVCRLALLKNIALLYIDSCLSKMNS